MWMTLMIPIMTMTLMIPIMTMTLMITIMTMTTSRTRAHSYGALSVATSIGDKSTTSSMWRDRF